MNRATVVVPSSLSSAFQQSLEALNRKAAAFGLDPITVVERRPVLYHLRREETHKGDLEVSWVRLNGSSAPPEAEVIHAEHIDLEYPIIRLGNWRVLGRVEAVENGALAFAITEDPEDIAQIELCRDHPRDCEHCKTKRPRKDTYVLRDVESGAYKQVGRDCLKDFTGHDPARILFLATMYQFIKVDYGDEGEFYGQCRPTGMATQAFLARAIFCSEQFGFVSSKLARERGDPATYEDAYRLADMFRGDEDLQRKFYGALDRLNERAAAIIEWARTTNFTDSFGQNLKLLLGMEAIRFDPRHMAVAAAAIPVYTRYMEKQAEKAQARERTHVGAVGEKMTSTLRLSGVYYFEGLYGTQARVNFRDTSGNCLSWKTAAATLPSPLQDQIAEPFRASFKVKEHGEYEGVPITQVSHLKFLGLEKDLAVESAAENPAPARRRPVKKAGMSL